MEARSPHGGAEERAAGAGARSDHFRWAPGWAQSPEGVVAAREGEGCLWRGDGYMSRVAVRGLQLSLRQSERGESVQEHPGAWTCGLVSSGENQLGCKLSYRGSRLAEDVAHTFSATRVVNRREHS